MNIKKITALILALALVLALGACKKKDAEASGGESSGGESASSPDIGVEAGYPVEVGGAELTAAPQSVVSLSPATTELICDLGFGEALAGVSDYCSYEAEDISALPRLGTVNGVKTDELTALAPNAVISASPLPGDTAAALTDAGIAVITLPRAASLDELRGLYSDIARIFEGDIAGTETGAAFYDKEYERIDAIAAEVNAQIPEEPPEAAYLRVMPLTLATGDSFEGELLKACGFTNSAEVYTEWVYPQDKAIDLMPDVIFYDKAVGIDALKASQIYNTTPAYKNEKCFEVDMEILERQGARMFTMLEEMTSRVLE